MKSPHFLLKIRRYARRRMRAVRRLDCFLVELSESDKSFSTHLHAILSLLNANRVLVEEVRDLRKQVSRLAEHQAAEREQWERLFRSMEANHMVEKHAIDGRPCSLPVEPPDSSALSDLADNHTPA